MDLSAFLEVEFEDDASAGLGDLTEDDIILLDNDYEEMAATHLAGSKRPPPASEIVPSKKMKQCLAPTSVNKTHHPHTAKDASHLTVTAKSSPAHKPLQPRPKMQQSITWKYRPLGENQYTADIRKAEMLKDYEPEQCSCKKPEEGQSPCGSGCINRSTYSECESGMCVNGELCSNMVIQRRQYAPGLERFMTSKKGWGVRARQSIAKNSFILEYTGEICSKEEFERRMLVRYKIDNHHYCLAMDNKMMIDAHRAGSECRFVNHSCSPNCEMQKWTVRGLPRMGLFALKDILPGEEICYDYNFSLFNTDQGQECKCGAKDCRGIIGGKNKDFLITLNDEDSKSQEEKAKNKPTNVKPVISQRILEEEKWFAEKVDTEEMEWIEKNALKPAQLEAKTLKCTVCNEHLDFKVQSQCHKHPDLGVLMCSKCKSQYGRGGWDKDKDGNDEFCRWCSEGGQIYLCDFCPLAFCSKCIRWNLGRKYLRAMEEDAKWKCLICDPSCIREQRALYWAILKYHRDRRAKLANNYSTPVRGSKSQHGAMQNSALKAKLQSNGVNINGVKSSSPDTKLGGGNLDTVRSVYKKLKSNSDVTVSPVSKNSQTQHHNIKKNGGSNEESKHFVDRCLLDVDDCVQQMVYMLGEVKKAWKLSGKNPQDVMVVTSKLRKALELAKYNIAEVDKNVIKATSTEISKSSNRVKEDVKLKPPKLSKVKSPGHKAGSSESEEGIHDVSVEELEVDEKESSGLNSQIAVNVETCTLNNVECDVNDDIIDEINTEQISNDTSVEPPKALNGLVEPKQTKVEEDWKNEVSCENDSMDAITGETGYSTMNGHVKVQ